MLSERSYAKAFVAYCSLVYVRGSVPSKENQATIKESVMDHEMEKNFKLGARDEKRDYFRFYIDGLVLGARDKVEAWLEHLKESGQYLRRKNPVPIKEGMSWFAIREQLSHFEG